MVLLLLLVVAAAVGVRPDLSPESLEALYTDDTSEFADLAGQRVHFRDQSPDQSGAAQTLVLIHGTASSLHTWDAWVAELIDHVRIVRLDLQGYGLTGRNAADDYSIERQIQTIEELRQRQGIEHMAVAGNSLGGHIAWRYALAHPERVSHLILIDPAGASTSPRFKDLVPPVGDGSEGRILDLASVPVLRNVLEIVTPKFLIRRALEQVYGDQTKVSDALVDRHHRLLRRRGSRAALTHSMNQKSMPPESPNFEDIVQPTLVMWGSEDTWIPISHAEVFHQSLPCSQLSVYFGIGHVPMEELPVDTAADALDFISQDPAGLCTSL